MRRLYAPLFLLLAAAVAFAPGDPAPPGDHELSAFVVSEPNLPEQFAEALGAELPGTVDEARLFAAGPTFESVLNPEAAALFALKAEPPSWRSSKRQLRAEPCGLDTRDPDERHRT